MDVTLQEVINIQHQALNTLPRKILFLMIKNEADATGWATISGYSLARATTLPRRSVDTILKHLINTGLIERRKTGPQHNALYQFRAIHI
ncbi:hypothetical protein [Pseudomonas sp.]|uniref:hypothetical protein n=1 Tax=Pseudomonas sp. TaxID=306 RepID=UPI0039822829